MKQLILYFCQRYLEIHDYNFHDIKKRKLFVFFCIITILCLFTFNLSHIPTGKYISAAVNSYGLLSLVFVLFSYKYKISFTSAANIFIYTSMTLLSFQHYHAPVALGSNLIILPIVIFVSFYLVPKKHTRWLCLTTIFFALNAEFLPKFGKQYYDDFSQLDINISNGLFIILSSVIAYLYSRNISSEQEHALFELEKMNRSLEKMKETNATLLFVLTHDIANLLTVGSHHSKRLSKYNFTDEKSSKSIMRISETFKTIEQMTNDIREIKGLEHGKLSIRLEKVNLSECLENAAITSLSI